MSFIYNFDELYQGQSLTDTSSELELDFGTDFVLQTENATFVNTFNPFGADAFEQLDQATVDALLDRGIPVGEGSAATFLGQPGVFESGEIPGLTAPQNSNFGFDFFVDNGGNADLDAFIPQVIAVASAAMEYLGQFIVAAEGASLEVGISLVQQGPSVVASAGAAALFLGGENADGVTEILTGTQIELITGSDPNGDDVDIFININTDFLTTPGAFLDTDPDRVVPDGSLDYVSVLVHEILHGLGFFSFRDNSGQDVLFDLNGDGQGQAIESTYGLNVSFEDIGEAFLSATYDSANIQDVYGDAVQLETTFNSGGSDVSHFALFNPDGSIADTALALMNPSVVGDVTQIGLLELAVLQDLFYTVDIPEGTNLVNELDGLPFTPTIATPSSIGFGGGIGVNVALDATSLFFTVPGSVGIEVSTLDGQSFSERVTVPADAPGVPFLFTEEMLRAIVETDIAAIDLRLFNPAQLTLDTGTNNATTRLTFIADLDMGTDGDDVMVNTFNLPSIYFAGSGNDVMTGSTDVDIFYGEAGNDRLFGRAGDDALHGGEGNDYLGGASGDDFLDGGADDDRLFGGSGNDTAFGGEGDDLVNGGGFDDFVDGGAGNDIVQGDSGNDTVLGGDGDDFVGGGAGNDIVDGGAGDDTVFGGSGADTLLGGDGADELNAQGGNDSLDGGAGNDRLNGGNGDDLLFGGDGNDVLLGGKGEDTLDGGLGNDRLFGGSSDDALFGGDGDDFLDGGGRNDTLDGGFGDDTLLGGGGDDVLIGGAGFDVLVGGTGSNIFVTGPGSELDIVVGFQDGIDMLDLSGFSDADIQAALDGKVQDDQGNTLLSFIDGTLLVLIGFDPADVTADDILNFDSEMMAMG